MNYSFIFLLGMFMLTPSIVGAAPEWVPLVGIPGISGTSANFGSYINTLYGLAISVAALLAVVKIIIAGVKYMLSDIVTQKGEAIAEIRGAIIGLVIVISAVLVLNVINPQLTQTNVFENITPITEIAPGGGTGSGVSPDITAMPGYRVRENNNADPSFRTTCSESDGYHEVVNDPVTNSFLEVCYDKLSSDNETRIRTWHNTIGSPYINEILSYYQMNVIPKEVRGDGSLESAIAASLDLTVVHLILDVSDPDDWIDLRNRREINNLCRDLRLAVHPEMVEFPQFTQGDKKYIGCGYKTAGDAAAS